MKPVALEVRMSAAEFSGVKDAGRTQGRLLSCCSRVRRVCYRVDVALSLNDPGFISAGVGQINPWRTPRWWVGPS